MKYKRNSRLIEYFNEQSGACAYCHTDMTLDLGHSNTATIDHVVPKSHGGKKNKFNELAACLKCNIEKGDKNVVMFLKKKVGDVHDGPILKFMI
jgi:5-methylcytosine-specific restriction endonuclease McrA